MNRLAEGAYMDVGLHKCAELHVHVLIFFSIPGHDMPALGRTISFSLTRSASRATCPREWARPRSPSRAKAGSTYYFNPLSGAHGSDEAENAKSVRTVWKSFFMANGYDNAPCRRGTLGICSATGSV